MQSKNFKKKKDSVNKGAANKYVQLLMPISVYIWMNFNVYMMGIIAAPTLSLSITATGLRH